MKVIYDMNKQELTKAMHHHFKHSGKTWVIMWPIIGSLMLYFGLSLMVSTGDYLFGTLICLLSLIFFFRKSIAVMRSVRRAFKRKPANQTISVEISETHLALHSDTTDAKAGWENFIDAHATKDGILLYSQKSVFNWIPKSPVEGGSWDEFSALICNKVNT